MKTIILMTAMLLAVAFADSAVAGTELNIRGYIAAYETYELDGDILKVDGTGTASLNGLGACTVTYHFDLNIITGSAPGSHQFTWPNGDSLSTTSLGQGILTDLDPGETINYVTEIHTITGGTGRFAHVSGNFLLERMVGFPLDSGATSGWFNGHISKSAP